MIHLELYALLYIGHKSSQYMCKVGWSGKTSIHNCELISIKNITKSHDLRIRLSSKIKTMTDLVGSHEPRDTPEPKASELCI
jgi:hypothetical protein